MRQNLIAEFLGTAFLVCTVVGSGIMAETLTDDIALALLGNTIATGAILYVLITILGPISGAHFNPAVSIVMTLNGALLRKHALSYIVFQIAGGILGTWIAHFMFEQSIVQISTNERAGLSQFGSEMVATFGLVLTILLGVRFRSESVAMLVGMYITAAYWFTSSTSFANPAVAIARSLTDTFSGIRPIDLAPFMIAQLIGAGVAMVVVRQFKENKG